MNCFQTISAIGREEFVFDVGSTVISLIVGNSMEDLDDSNVEIVDCRTFLGNDVNGVTKVLDKAQEDVLTTVMIVLSLTL